jgi:predicted short-subunit dehydrogenase-like oxidoreductase (DUF2520 family)
MIHYNISFAGAGRVAGALCREMYRAGHNIGLIVSETEENGVPLADSSGARWSGDLKFPDNTDVIIVAVPDHKLSSVLGKMEFNPETLIVHTAGSFGLDVFNKKMKRKGVLYPLQTFSMGRNVNFKDLPVFIESTDDGSSDILISLAESIGCQVYFTTTEQRRMLHLAAVFVCNFTNHMLRAGKEVALRAGFPFDVLRPLLEETYLKAADIGPESAQTGPAIRNDINTIEKHLELLSFSPELLRIYEEMTQSIIKYYTKQ